MTSRLRFSAAGFFWLCLSVPMGAMAQTDGAALPAQGIDIPSQPLIDALGALGDLAGYQVSADADLLEGRRSAAVIGAPSPEAALTTMLSGTGLTFRSLGADGAVLERAAEDGAISLDTIVVTGTRTERPLGQLSQQVTVIEREEIEREAAFANNNLINVISRLAPGVSPPQGDGRSEDFTIRGRPALLLIDGVPQNSNDGFSTEFNAIDPAAIERVEVLRGASAIYGEGAAGGIINIITRSPDDRDGLAFETRGTLRVQPSSLDEGGDGFGGRVEGSASGRFGPVSGLLSVATDIDQGFFDADGERIPADIAVDNREVNLLAKLGFDIDEDQTVSLSYNFFNTNFETEFISDFTINNEPLGAVAEAVNVGNIDFDDKPAQTVQNLNLSYINRDLFGARISGQLFYRKTDISQQLADIRDAAFLPFFPAAPGIFQTTFEAEEYGGRLVIEAPVTDDITVTVGADFSFDDQIGNNNVIDEVLFETENRAAVTDTVTAIPPFEQRNVAGFILGEWQALPWLRLNAGARYETIRLEIDDFTASPFDAFDGLPQEIEGGSVSTDDFVFNAGAVIDVTDRLSVTANFSQGFALPPFLGSGLLAFPVSSGVTAISADTFGIEAEKVNNFEGGIRYDGDDFFVSAAGFYNFSDNGAAFLFNPDTEFLDFVQAEQRNFGIEFEGDWRPIDRLLVGGSITWADGNIDAEGDGEFVALSTVEVPPWQLRAFAEDETLPNWRNRVSFLYVGSRDRGFEDGVDPLPIDGYGLVDLVSTYAFGDVTVSAGIQNLLDNDYIPVSSQTESLNATRFRGVGRVFTLSVGATF